jgi:hypothetical protein
MARRHSEVVQIRSEPLVIFSAIVLADMVHVHAGVVSVETSRTKEMSLPATGFGTDGVIATSLAAQGPEGMAAGVADGDAVCSGFW